jgi:hypothetical protein
MLLRSAIRISILAASVMLAGGCLSKSESSTGQKPGVVASGVNNRAPTIFGTPNSAVMTGDTYSFTPSASDADGDPMTFSIANKPRWASFDTTTGRLSGQALLGDEGLYQRISISVTDGGATSSLPEFSIQVTQTALGSMTLTWIAPTENSDGTVLTDLAGYNLYYGVSAGNYPNRIRINNPSISTYIIENLLPDTYFVVATSFNASGIESVFSNMATKMVASQ